MDQLSTLPTRPPSVCSRSAQEMTFETVDIGKIFVPANALLITEDENLFLAATTVLKDLKRVLLGRKVGYVFFGMIAERTVFVLNAGLRTTAVNRSMKILQPRAAIFLGFCKSLTKSMHVGDVVVADALTRKDPRTGKVGCHACDEYLLSVFYDGRFGWMAPRYRKQAVHKGKVLQISDVPRQDKAGAVALKTTGLDAVECCKNLVQEWISVLGITGPQCFHSNASWEPYVASVVASFVNRVLQDDQVFSVLEGGDRSPCQRQATLVVPLQESNSEVKAPTCGSQSDFSVIKGCEFASEFTQENVKKQAEFNWRLLQQAIAQEKLAASHQNASIPLRDDTAITAFAKTPVENCDQKTKSTAPDIEPLNSHGPLINPRGPKTNTPSRLALPPIPSTKVDEFHQEADKNQMAVVSSNVAQSPRSALSSSIAVAMQTILPPVGAALVTRGSCFEIIRIKSQETASSVKSDGALPPIGQARNVCPTRL